MSDERAVDERFMARALMVARRGLGRTAPNPSVGAVLVRDGEILGEGHTRPVGGPHAEREAIRDARGRGHDLRGATMYVTLEPCRHHGRTPPCTDAILEAGLARVVVGVVDPFPPMRGRGLDALRDGGVAVELGVLAEACARSVLGFVRSVVAGLPEVTCKIATSLDGRLATAAGESKWITSEAARAHAHQLRSEHDAVLVGIGTVLADDPRLTVRTPDAPDGADPVPVVLDTALRIPDGAALLAHPRGAVVICAEDAPARDLPARIVRVPRGDHGRVDVEAALRAIVGVGLHRVLVEGGAAVHRSLLDARLVDTLCVYVAPVLIPGGRPWLGGAPLEALAAAPRFGAPTVEALGPDVLLRYAVPHRLVGSG